MSELAFNQNGDSFEIPAGVTGWRVRRMKPRGAPELVYGNKDGRPLVLPIEANMDDLREAVGQLGRYRLDPVNDDGKVIESLPAAYIQVVKSERSPAPLEVAPREESDGVVREAMRLNTDLAKAVIEQFPLMMTAAAELLRAADGAGLPARRPRLVETDDDDDEDDDDDGDDDRAPRLAPGFDFAALIPQLAPVLMTLFGKGGIDLGAMLDWRKAVPTAPRALGASTATAAPTSATTERPSTPSPASESTAGDVLPPIDMATMAHFIAIQSALAPDEAALAREVAGELAPGELRAWFHELTALSVPDAVTKIRTLIGGAAPKGGAA